MGAIKSAGSGALSDSRKSLTPSATSKLGVTMCSHSLVGEVLDERHLSPQVSQNSMDSTDFAMVDKRASMMEGGGGDNLVLKMNQVQRICENRVNCFVQCRYVMRNGFFFVLFCFVTFTELSQAGLKTAKSFRRY